MDDFVIDPTAIGEKNRFLRTVDKVVASKPRKSPGKFITGPADDDNDPETASSKTSPASIPVTGDKKEPDDFSADIRKYVNDPTPEAGDALLERINPVIHRAMLSNVSSPSPVLVGRARILALKSLPKYDGRSNLYTYLSSQLMPLRREAAAMRVGVKVPRNLVQEKASLKRISDELEDDLGRSPSMAELADRSGLPISKLKQLHSLNLPQISEREFESEDGEVSTASDQGVSSDVDMWRQAVYYTLNPQNQVIMEHSLGLFGKPILSNQEIARRLKISPSAVTQRKSVIQQKLNQVER